ncbi:MAG TPA: ribonuclease HII [Verrucomicrobiae bacterium]|nr:ribonuclease HII [Verrucomicrobiae bacterium]
MKFPTYKFEQQKLLDEYSLVAGCDEVGIAPLAGPVVAATVILDPSSIGRQRSKSKWWYRVRDSKTVNEKERAQLVNFIKEHCLDYGVGVVSHETIDEINIYHAAQLAMRKSFDALKLKPQFLFIDGIHKVKGLDVMQQAVVDGDAKILSISAASIIAKVARDQLLAQLDETFPVYGLAKHKGYPTLSHRNALMIHGVSPIHRTSFTFVQQVIKQFCSTRNFRKLVLSL